MIESINKRSNLEVSDILQTVSCELKAKYQLHPVQLKAMDDIITCRTAIKGGHKQYCRICGYTNQSYNSCRNRHCPKCQFIKQEQWVDKLQSRLLPCKYFHIVFTLPEKLNKIIYINQQSCYDLLFKSSWEALRLAGLNPSFLGGKVGAVSILHTWGQTLSYHPHIHMIVPAGALSEDNMEWLASSRNFFVPIKALSGMFRGIFYKGLINLMGLKKVRLPDDYQGDKKFKAMVYKKNWNVYAKKAFGSVNSVLKYCRPLYPSCWNHQQPFKIGRERPGVFLLP